MLRQAVVEWWIEVNCLISVFAGDCTLLEDSSCMIHLEGCI
jgi:hypothetical protein